MNILNGIRRPKTSMEAKVAEGQGFEPWDVLPSLVFKTSAFDHSATPPVDAINATKTTAPVRAQV